MTTLPPRGPVTPNSVHQVDIDIDMKPLDDEACVTVQTPKPSGKRDDNLASSTGRPTQPPRPDDGSDHRQQQVLAVAAEVTDTNIILTAHVEALRARVMELEEENGVLRQREEVVGAAGIEVLVGGLQADIAGLQRELALLKVAKRNIDAELEAEKAKNELLRAILESGESRG